MRHLFNQIYHDVPRDRGGNNVKIPKISDEAGRTIECKY